MQKIVRVASLSDFDFIYDSIREDLNEQGVLHRFRYSKEEFKEAIFGDRPLAYFLILEINGAQAGFANYSIDHRNFTVNSLANLYLNDLFVKPSFRKMGGATLLMDELKIIAIKEKCGRIEGFVLKDNSEALQFYQTKMNSKIISENLHYMRLELI